MMGYRVQAIGCCRTARWQRVRIDLGVAPEVSGGVFGAVYAHEGALAVVGVDAEHVVARSADVERHPD